MCRARCSARSNVFAHAPKPVHWWTVRPDVLGTTSAAGLAALGSLLAAPADAVEGGGVVLRSDGGATLISPSTSPSSLSISSELSISSLLERDELADGSEGALVDAAGALGSSWRGPYFR